MVSDLPPPRSVDPPPPPPQDRTPGFSTSTRGEQRRRWEPVAWVLGVVAVLLIGAVVVIFTAGEYLFGSDSATIDSYNSEVLESCELPSDSELVQVSISTSHRWARAKLSQHVARLCVAVAR